MPRSEERVRRNIDVSPYGFFFLLNFEGKKNRNNELNKGEEIRGAFTRRQGIVLVDLVVLNT